MFDGKERTNHVEKHFADLVYGIDFDLTCNIGQVECDICSNEFFQRPTGRTINCLINQSKVLVL